MRVYRLVWRNLLFHWRTNLAVIGGVGIAVAVLSGALLVGRSVRGSLQHLLFQRIGSTDAVVSSNNFFGEHLTSAFAAHARTAPIIHLKGIVVRESTRVRVYGVNVYGIDEQFWKFHGVPAPAVPDDRSALVGAPLARQLQLHTGDGLLLRIETQQEIPREWLYGRRDDAGRTIRLNCGGMVDESALGEFALRPSQGTVFSLFVPLRRLQKDLAQPARINTILLSHRNAGYQEEYGQSALKLYCTLQDFGLRLRRSESGRDFSLESGRILLDDFVYRSATQAAAETGLPYSPLYTYLATSIRANGREIPYSVITAADLGQGALASIPGGIRDPRRIQSPLPGNAIRLTDWAARDLGISVGDPVEIDYYLWLESGQLATRSAKFRLSEILPASKDINGSMAPEIPGITEARSISDWDPPFPVDLARIRRKDEDFWNRHKATPKAFIDLAAGQKLWQNRFGQVTAIRMRAPDAMDPEAAMDRFSHSLLRRLDPQRAGISITPIRKLGLAASAGSTDFGEYFVYFSSFLIAAAILLSVLFFRLMVEQRIREIGMLRAAGFSIRQIQRIFLLEGVCLSFAGILIGALASLGYGWLMVYGLRTWWLEAVGTRRIQLHVASTDLYAGAIAVLVFSLASILWTLRGLKGNSPRMLLAGVLESADGQIRRTRGLTYAAAGSAALATILLVASAVGTLAPIEGFFACAFLLLISILCSTALLLRIKHSIPIHGRGWPAFMRLGLRNARYRPGRSLVCATLIASAVFIILSMETFRQDAHGISLQPKSGTGGYPLVAEAALPIIYDLNSNAGREATGLNTLKGAQHAHIISFRERPGDDASCLNLYAPREPKILGASRTFLESGRFSFQSSIATDVKFKTNPWLLLEALQPRDSVPAIADANTIQYILHRSIGDEIVISGDDGNPIRLRLVAALKDSIFQGELLISESNFVRLFPEHQGYRFFLLDIQETLAEEWKQQLQELLSDQGLSVQSSRERLAAYHRVENTYLSTFQSLGALGLVLGTLGLATILLRNVLERRSELAVLRAAGYRKRILIGIILSENIILVLWGLAVGGVCAFLAILPALSTRAASYPVGMPVLLALAVLLTGMLASTLAVIAALRSPILISLRSE